ncbi:MAG: hypothetical protein IJR48_02940, partial [Oscillibacter sp.]|nr:hypothetical protein [Oscillibacter sp.]
FKEKKNYDDAITFLRQLFEDMNIDPRQDVFIVPGNHDVDYSKEASFTRKPIIQGITPDDLNTSGEGRDYWMGKLLSSYKDYQAFVKELESTPRPSATRINRSAFMSAHGGSVSIYSTSTRPFTPTALAKKTALAKNR